MLDLLKKHIKEALLGGDKLRTETLKLTQAALQNAQIAKGGELTEQESITVIQKEIKKRREAADMYKTAGHIDRADREISEQVILEEFVPKLLNGDELASQVERILSSNQVNSFSDAMKVCLTELNNPDKAELASLLKQKFSG